MAEPDRQRSGSIDWIIPNRPRTRPKEPDPKSGYFRNVTHGIRTLIVWLSPHTPRNVTCPTELTSSWVKDIFTTAGVFILVNNSPKAQFSLEKGIRQGGPMSPYLFILAIKGVIKGVKLPDDSPSIASLHFADDTFSMGKWDERNIHNLMKALSCFHQLKVYNEGWKQLTWGLEGGPISAEGHLTLCNSGLEGLGVYLFSIFKAPLSIIHRLERIL
ncbi:hypothetical protein OSB04_022721 [Centaurea solstitialis]|uniref:Reverse transcriptase domain-containing protein n=1 Tax=Centaurea solstitialis TaxID=347529 RepID=A0AA38SHQ1_9ASTR|nr:hypothetical protein OSB04_022721 [Centaurea solstitialis]